MTGPSIAAKARDVARLRLLFRTNRAMAAVVIAMALAMRLLSPVGFMPVVTEGRIIVSLCSGTGPTTMAMPMPMPGMTHDAPGESGHEGRSEPPCAFAGLSAPSLAATDVALLAIAILFVLALGLRIVATPPVRSRVRLRPPPQGPPPSL